MKFISGFAGAAIVAALVLSGCNTAGHYQGAALRPAIMLDAPHEVAVGESQRIVAHTQDTAGAKSIQWTVEPNTARVTAENSTSGQSAMFTSNQRGRYIVTARVDMGNNQMPVENSTTIDVIGGAQANEMNR